MPRSCADCSSPATIVRRSSRRAANSLKSRKPSTGTSSSSERRSTNQASTNTYPIRNSSAFWYSVALRRSCTFVSRRPPPWFSVTVVTSALLQRSP